MYTEVAKQILTTSKILGIELRERYCPRICYKCGEVVDTSSFHGETNGKIHHAFRCELPVKKSLEEISALILQGTVSNLEADGENNAKHIFRELSA